MLYLVLYFISTLQYYDVVSFELERRVNNKGVTVKSAATIYYKQNGDMVTAYAPPNETFIFNNKDGEIKIYNKLENTVIQSTNYQYGSETNNFYYFLEGYVSDMGLTKSGFFIESTNFDDGLMVTLWEPPKEMKAAFDKVELVQKNDLPVFLGHLDKKGNYISKVFYYDYEMINSVINFPKSITQIDYVGDDSVITKNSFDRFHFDGEVDLSIFDFKIPEDAKVLE